MYMFEECCCGVGMISAESPPSLLMLLCVIIKSTSEVKPYPCKANVTLSYYWMSVHTKHKDIMYWSVEVRCMMYLFLHVGPNCNSLYS